VSQKRIANNPKHPEPLISFGFRAGKAQSSKQGIYSMCKKLCKQIFLSLLSICFLNIVCSHTSYASSKKGFVKPLILADYDAGTLSTNLDCISGGDEGEPGTTYAHVTSNIGEARGNHGYSLKLDYDVSEMGEFSFYWIKLGKELKKDSGITKTLNLSGYNYLSFWVKGSTGGESIKVELHEDRDNDGAFYFDRDITSFVYTSAYIKGGVITKDWQKVLIPFKSFSKIKNWSNIIELVFVFENISGIGKSTVFLDDILFGSRPDEVLMSKKPKEIKPPIAKSFKVNGNAGSECGNFGKDTSFQIKAENYNENPFLESVRFEHSADKGATWHIIGRDYDLRKNIYKITWQPKDMLVASGCQIRAVSEGIRGDTGATDVLIERSIKPLSDDEFLDLLEKKAFKFYYDHQNLKTGLFNDASGGGDASIASTGFGLTALCVGAERGWIGKEEALKRVELAIDAFLPSGIGKEPLASGKYGFFYHFLDINTGKRAGKSEISTVDTAILVCGAITAGEYFGEVIKEKAETLYRRVEWNKFLCTEEGPCKNLFSMGWSPERGFLSSNWDFYTDEVILIALLAIGSPTYPCDSETFYAWARMEGSYEGGKPFIYSWHGALFSYQYAHVWFDLRDMVDKKGVDWFENSVNATLANRQFCIDNQDKFKGYGPNSWGITSMDRPSAYTMHFGTPPTGSGEPQYDGTISPTGPAGSIIFTPYLSLSALKYIYLNYLKMWGGYGLRDSFDLDSNWYSQTYYGIGVAMILFPIENFRSGFIWKQFMKNEHVIEALSKAGFTKKK